MADYIVFDQVDFYYNHGTPFQKQVLFDISIKIPRQQVTAIIGHTGSGKSTLIQHLNVLNRPSEGTVTIDGERVTKESKNKNLKPLRKKVGVVFQFPESQLFEETVLKDVMFGPLNFGATEEEAREIAIEKLKLVGLPETLYERSPFDLSGGQMRRVAIAGVLALNPEVLVLDEPTAGLDPLGHLKTMEMFMKLFKDQGITLVMVTHQMEDVANYADYVIAMDHGTIAKTGTPKEIFSDYQWLIDHQMTLPYAMDLYLQIERRLNLADDQLTAVLNADDLADEIIKLRQKIQAKEDV